MEYEHDLLHCKKYLSSQLEQKVKLYFLFDASLKSSACHDMKVKCKLNASDE